MNIMFNFGGFDYLVEWQRIPGGGQCEEPHRSPGRGMRWLSLSPSCCRSGPAAATIREAPCVAARSRSPGHKTFGTSTRCDRRTTRHRKWPTRCTRAYSACLPIRRWSRSWPRGGSSWAMGSPIVCTCARASTSTVERRSTPKQSHGTSRNSW